MQYRVFLVLMVCFSLSLDAGPRPAQELVSIRTPNGIFQKPKRAVAYDWDSSGRVVWLDSNNHVIEETVSGRGNQTPPSVDEDFIAVSTEFENIKTVLRFSQREEYRSRFRGLRERAYPELRNRIDKFLNSYAEWERNYGPSYDEALNRAAYTANNQATLTYPPQKTVYRGNYNSSPPTSTHYSGPSYKYGSPITDYYSGPSYNGITDGPLYANAVRAGEEYRRSLKGGASEWDHATKRYIYVPKEVLEERERAKEAANLAAWYAKRAEAESRENDKRFGIQR